MSEALPAWQDVVTLHPHLADNSADYAVHLSDVLRDDDHTPWLYRDPSTFFQVTHPTEQLQRLLLECNERLTGIDGPRILRLQAGFGGGKSHALLALYHWCQAAEQARQQPGWDALPSPPTTRLVAISGLDLDPHAGLQPEGAPSSQTLWGLLAWQLGGQAAWEALRRHDEQRTAPGGELLRTLLHGQPTLLLLDELALYVEKTQSMPLGASTFGAQNVLFLQTLTEVVRSLPQAAMVYALQATADEIAGADGLLAALGHLSHRLESQRQPLQPHELHRVLRRRLFLDPGASHHHQQVADAYVAAWQRYDATIGRRKQRYQQEHQRICESYPFHPALLALMTEQWWSIPTYQRTRGALQLCSHALLAPDTLPRHPLLAPAALPIDTPWRRRLWAQLGATAAHETALEHELLSPESVCQQLEADALAPGPATSATERLASPTAAEETESSGSLRTKHHWRALTRSLCLFSFGGDGPTTRGLLSHECCRMSLHPDTHPARLEAAWQQLRERLGFLHEKQRRFRLLPTPNLQHQLDQLSQRWSEAELQAALKAQLHQCLQREAHIHLWPSDGATIPDGTPWLQWVFLDPSWRDCEPEEAQRRLQPWFTQRTPNRLRQYRNGLVLLQPSMARWPSLAKALAQHLSLDALAHDPDIQRDKGQTRQLEERRELLQRRISLLALQLYQTVWLSHGGPEQPPTSIDLSHSAPAPEAPLQRYFDALEAHHYLCLTLTPDKMDALARGLLRQGEQPSGVPLQRLQDAFFGFPHFPRLASLAPANAAIDALIVQGRWQIAGDWPAATERSDTTQGWDPQENVTLTPTPPADADGEGPSGDHVSPGSDAPDDAKRPPADATPQPKAGPHELRLRLSPKASQWSSLAGLLRQLDTKGDELQIEVQLRMTHDAPLSQRWLALKVEDALEELGVDYELNCSSQSGGEKP